jgi:hypothetical protein
VDITIDKSWSVYGLDARRVFMRLLRFVLLLLISLVFPSAAAVGAAQRELYLIDAHSQVDETLDLNKIISLMDQAGVQYTILSAFGRRRPAEIVRFSKQHPDRIIPAVRMKSQGVRYERWKIL